MATSVIGFHYSLGGNKSGIGLFMDKLSQASIPFLFKGVDDAGLCFIGQTKGNNHLIYRVSTAGQNNGVSYDVPDYTKSPKAAAQEHFNKTAPKWPPELNRSVVWMEPINEPRAKLNPGDVQYQNMHPVNWLGYFMTEYAILANAQGFKVCGPSFNSGEPEVFTVNDYEQPGMLDYLNYCAIYPDEAALSVHEYTWNGWQYGQSWADWYPFLWGRVEAAIAAADRHNIPRLFQIFMTEWGFDPYEAPRWPECEPHLTAYNKWAARWPQVKGVAAWTLQAGWGDVDDDLQSWFVPLGEYTVNQNFAPGQQPAPTHVLFGSTLPGGQPVKTLEQTLWDATVEEQNKNGIKLATILGIWKEMTLKDSSITGWVPVTKEFTVSYSGKDYQAQAGEDPQKVQKRRVYYWISGQPIKSFTNPYEVVEPGPFEFAAYPVQGRQLEVTSPWNAPRTWYPDWTNKKHEGVDLRANTGENVVAVADGTVDYLRLDPGSGYGTVARVKHDDRHVTWYGHLKDYVVSLGQFVKAGQLLGHADNTGDSTGSHLHLTLQDLIGGLNGYYVAKVVDPTPFLQKFSSGSVIDLTRFMKADKTAWRVVRMPNGSQEDVQELDLGGGLYVRRKNQLAEWWKVDGSFFYLVHDTSPDKGQEGIERVYTLTKNGVAGAPKNPLSMKVGQKWTESGTHHVQFRAKQGCANLSENSGNATNSAELVAHKTNYIFNSFGQNLKVDEAIWIKTGDETQIYARKDGKAIGWCGWSAPWGSSEIVELYWDRAPMTTEPNRYCSW